MGLFDDTVTYIESSTQPLYDQNVKGLLDQSIFSSIVQNRNIGTDIVTNIINSIGFKARSMYQFGKLTEDGHSGGYYYGLPSGSYGYYQQARNSQVQMVIESEVGGPIQLITCTLDIANSAHEARRILDTQGYDPLTGIVTNPPFTPQAPSSVFYYTGSFLANSTTMTIDYREDWDVAGTPYTANRSTNYTIDAVVLGDLYYYATYFLVDAQGNPTGTLQYWQYRENDGTYLTLDVPDEDEDATSLYYPVCPIRQNGRDIRDESDEIWQSVRSCLRRIDVDLEEVASAVHDNPDINDIDHAYIMLGVDIATTTDVGNRFLFNYFSREHDKSRIRQVDYDYWVANDVQGGPPPVNIVTVQDAATYKIQMSWNYSTRVDTIGSIGKVGTVEKTYFITEPIHDDNNTYSAQTSTLRLRMQVTSGVYSTLEIHGLQHVNYVYSGDTVNTSLFEAFDDPDDKNNFYVPLNIDVLTNDMGVFDTHDVMYEAIRIVFNTKVVQKLKWYETFWGQLVIIIVVAVITFFTGGSTSGALATAIAGTGASAAVAAILANIVIGIAFKIGIGIVEDVFGEEAGLIVAIFAVVYGSVSVDGSSVSLALPNADSLVGLATAGITYGQTQKFKSESQKLADELEALQEEEEELDELLNLGLDDPLNIIGIGADFDYNVTSDSPEQFYDTAIHRQNVGVLSLDSIDLFITGKLKLEIPNSPIRNKVY